MSRYQIFDAFQDIILVVDHEWRLFYGNTSACLLLEVTPRRLSIGKPVGQFMEFQAPITSEAGISAIRDQAPAREVSFSLPASGKTGWVQTIIQPVPPHLMEPDEVGGRWIISMRDTTLERTLNQKYRGELDQKESVIRDLIDARKALEDYSLRLEKRVEERTSELSVANRLQKTILDSLGQGILVFDKDGVCLPIFSKVVVKMLGEPTGRRVEELLGYSGTAAEGFNQWREAVFDQLLDFEDMVPLAPNHMKNADGLELHFDYYPMWDANNRLQGIVIVATDQTREVKALAKAAEERELVGKVTQVARNRDAFRLFNAEAKRLLLGLQTPDGLDMEDITRRLHTLKGGAASFSLMAVADACHELENNVKLMIDAPSRDEMNAMLVEKSQMILDLMASSITELVELLGPSIADVDNMPVELAIDQLKFWAKELYAYRSRESVQGIGDAIMREATQKPVGPAILHHASSLKSLAATMGKQLAEFQVEGADVKVPADRMQGLLTSLVHAFRNSVYHGLETGPERVKAGKAEGGTVFAHFMKADVGNETRLRIEIGDNGRGVDPARIRKKLLEVGLPEVAAGTDEEVIQAILRDDFSTSTEVNLVAGRGVGLSAIAAEVIKLNGTIIVVSRLGLGMSLKIEIPLHLHAVRPGMRVA